MIITNIGKLNRAFAAICVSCLLSAGISGNVQVSAKSSTNLTASTATAERGSVVSVNVALNGNPGIWGIKFKVGCDRSALALSSVSNGTVFADDEVTLPQAPIKDQYVYYACSNELENVTANGTVVTLKFKVSEDAEFSTYPITVSLTQAVNTSRKNVSMDTQNGAVTVVECIHNKVWRTTKAAECEAEGTETETCSKCEETFAARTIEATGHQHTEVRNQRPATSKAEGYTGDTYCKDCGKLLSQGSVIDKLPINAPAITRGNGAVFDKNSNNPLVFVSDTDFSTFIRVEIDGTTLDKKHYTVASGSTVVTISSDYLKTLSDGRHTVAIVSQGGTATAEFTVTSEKTPIGNQPGPAKAPPNTSENTIIYITMLVLVLCSGSLAAFIKRRRKC